MSDKFEKALNQVLHTRDDLESWQELGTRYASVPASLSVEAAKVIAGLEGSWTHFQSRSLNIRNTDYEGSVDVPSEIQVKSLRIGQPGLPEINFVPYGYGTNRYGDKGPSLLGHPISFEVLGPTLKTPANVWQWAIVDNSGTPGVGDTLSLDSVDIEGNAVAWNVADLYNLSLPVTNYNGGLYLYITQTGQPGLIDNGVGGTEAGGLGDGFVNTSGSRNPLNWKSPYNTKAKGELFRIDSIAAGVITLNPNKRLATYFTIPVTNPVCRAITIVQPYVTRLKAVPGSGSGTGREQSFFFLPPERSANADFSPPYDTGTPSDGSWVQGGFEAAGSAGDSGSYGDKRNLPVPVPLRLRKGRIHKTSDGVAEDIGLWKIFDTESLADITEDQNKVILVFSIEKSDSTSTLQYGEFKNILGWYEVADTDNIGIPKSWLLRRVADVNPKTGELFFGPGPITTNANDIEVLFTVHDRIEDLFTSSEYRRDDIEAARLSHLIDPAWSQRSTKNTDATLAGSTPNRPDRSLWNTRTDADPGSLFDLGFRVVLFPGKLSADTTKVIPDFDRPIESREVIIDPSISAQQTIDIDYAGGLVRLSHAPPASSSGEIVPNGIITGGAVTNNPTGEVVLFASCVPYSREKTQSGTGIHYTVGSLESANAGLGHVEQHDVFSERVYFPIMGDTGVGSQTIDSSTTSLQSIILNVEDTEDLLPPTGFVEIIAGGLGPYGSPGAAFAGGAPHRASTFGYTRKITSTVNSKVVTVLEGVYGGGRSGTTITVVNDGDYNIVLRRDVTTPNDLEGQVGSDFAHDVVFGHAARSNVFRMQYGSLRYLSDGSIVVTPTATQGPAEELRSQFPLGSTSEKARFFFDPVTQTWTISAPAYQATTENEVGLSISRGRMFAGMSHNIPTATINLSWYLNRGTSVEPNSYNIGGKTPSRFINLLLDDDPNTSKGLSGYRLGLPDHGFENNLCAVIEGSSVISKRVTTWPGYGGADLLTPGTRFIVQIKDFGDRSINTDTLLSQDEGPANPTNWFAYTVGTPNTLTDLVSAINTFYSPLVPALEWLPNSGDAADLKRLLVTERQVDVLPALPYLQSDVVGSFTFNDGARYTISVYSADPKNKNQRKWITFTGIVEVDGAGSVALTDANDVAALLNRPLYDSSISQDRYVGNLLDHAGFWGTPIGVDASPNPYINSSFSPTPPEIPALAGSTPERQFLWIGPNDPRHPDGTDTVCLLCGGFGSSIENSTVRDFYNVIVEIGQQDSSLASADRVFATLGGDFVLQGSDIAPRCGLFFGTDASDTPVTPPVTADYTAAQAVSANANTGAGFPSFGVLALGAMVGSFPIKSAITDGFKLEIPGGAFEFFGGDKRLPPPQEPFGFYNEETLVSYPYMGRHQWHQFPRVVQDLTNDNSSGIAHIHVSYSSKPFSENGFVCGLTHPNTQFFGYDSFLVCAETSSTSLQLPKFVYNNLKAGDILLGNEVPGGARDGSEAAWEGVVFDRATPTTGGNVAFAFMCYRGQNWTRTQALGSNPGHLYSRHIQPKDFGTWTGSGIVATNTQQISILSNANPYTESLSALFKYENAFGPSVFPTGGSDAGDGFGGGQTTSDRTSLPSSVLIGGGRISLLSLLGGSVPSGFGFASPVVGSDASSIRFASTFLEHGVFTTSLSLREGLLGPAHDSAGVFDAFQKKPFGQIEGGEPAGGLAGLRISGDTQLWVSNLRSLGSTIKSALIRPHYPYQEESDISGLPEWNLQTGPIDQLGKGRIQDRSFGHMPSGFGTSQTYYSNNTHFLQQATVEVGLSRPDFLAFMVATGNFSWPKVNDPTHHDTSWIDAEKEGQGSFLLAQSALEAGQVVPVPFLVGCYIQLGARNFTVDNAVSFDIPTNDTNTGTWRISGTPLITQASHRAFLTGGSFDSGPSSLSVPDPNPEYLFPYNTRRESLARRQPGGHAPGSAIVAVIQMRVERWSQVNTAAVAGESRNTFVPEIGVNEPGVGHAWNLYADEDGNHPIYVADIMEPGGSPDGSPSALRGITINPSALRKGHTLPIDLVGVFGGSTNDTTTAWPLVGRGRLFGVFGTQDHRGREYSQAFFSMETGATATSFSEAQRKSVGRIIVYSSQRDDRVDDTITGNTTEGEFFLDAAGRISYVGHPQRLGLGILFDGGLGIMQTTAYRTHPKSDPQSMLGSLSLYGHNATYPLPAYSRPTQQSSVTAPSLLGETEFHGDVVIVGPKGKVSFENSRASRGLPYHLNALLYLSRSGIDPLQRTLFRSHQQDTLRLVAPNDTIFPDSSEGIVFKSPGTIRYERTYRPLDSTGSEIQSPFEGKASRNGVKGLEIPTFGECVLVPKGPPTIYGAGSSNFREKINVGATGETPTDLPLYEFFGAYDAVSPNGQPGVAVSPYFPVIPGTIFSGDFLVASDPDAGYLPHKSQPGNVFQGYRHTISREDGTFYQQKSRDNQNGLSTPDPSEQVRLLDGMVLEDVDNGTFFTVGSLGRWKEYRVIYRTVDVTAVAAGNSIDITTPEGVVTLTEGVDFALGGSATDTATNLKNAILANASAQDYDIDASSAAAVVTVYGPLTAVAGTPGGNWAIGAVTVDSIGNTSGLDQPGADTDNLSLIRRSIVNGSLVSSGGGYAFMVLWFHFNGLNDFAEDDSIDIKYTDPGGTDRITTFTFKAAPASSYEVTRSGTANNSLINLVTAINALANNEWAADTFNRNGGFPKAQFGQNFTYSGDSTYPIFIRIDRLGSDGNRWGIDNVNFTVDPGGFKSLSTGHIVGGSDTDFRGGYEQEVIYDLGEHHNVRVPLHINDTTRQQNNGLGDRVDGGVVRRPLKGHRYRITPNVEFVPVLGPRGVDGGLLPPMLDLTDTDPTAIIPNADAVFFTHSYSFRAGSQELGNSDVGRFLYLCGTSQYAYTGWWLIIGVLENYSIPHSDASGDTSSFTVAVLRKWKRGLEVNTGNAQQDGAFPLRFRSPIVRMVADKDNNETSIMGLFAAPGGSGTYSDLRMVVTQSDGSVIADVTVTAATLEAGSVDSCKTLADYANASADLNGTNLSLTGGGVANCIVWVADYNSNYSAGATVSVYYDFSNLTAIQKAELIGHKASLRVQFFSNTTGNHTSADGPKAVGFYSYLGHNSQVDHSLGDRNNAATLKSAPGVAAEYIAKTTAYGLRWIFSSPLTEEHTGSYLHLTRSQKFRFGVELPSQITSADGSTQHTPKDDAWTEGHPSRIDVVNGRIPKTTEIFRVNRCANTTDILLGGDCEVYQPEIIEVSGVRGLNIQYSPVSVSGNWPDSTTGKLPTTRSAHLPTTYALQPIAREKIVKVPASNIKSNVLMGHGFDQGMKGVGPLLASGEVTAEDSDLTAAFSLSQPWVNYDRSMISRSSNFDKSNGIMEVFNANDPRTTTGDLDQDNYSTYAWSPGSDWWQLNVPYIYHTIRNPRIVYLEYPSGGHTLTINGVNIVEGVDYTTPSGATYPDGDARKQVLMQNIAAAINANGTLNTTITASAILLRDPLRDMQTTHSVVPTNLNNINDGRWAVKLEPHHAVLTLASSNAAELAIQEAALQYDASSTPPTLRVDLTETFTQAMQPGSGINSPYSHHHPKGARLNRIWVNFGVWGNTLGARNANQMPGYFDSSSAAFDNLVLSINHICFNLVVEIPSSQTRRLPKAKQVYTVASNLAALDTVTIGALTLTAVAAAPSTNEFLIGANVSETARNLAAAINTYSSEAYAYEIGDGSTTGLVRVEAQAGGTDGNSLASTTSVPAKITIPSATFSGGSNHPLGSGTSSSPFGGRAPFASYAHGDNSEHNERFTGGSIVIPLYCNREGGDLMPNIMERFNSVGPTPTEALRDKGGNPQPTYNPASDWEIGDSEHGFGCTSDTVYTTEDTQFHPDYLDLYSGSVNLPHDALSSNAHNPVLWGGIDFDTAISGKVSTDAFRAPFEEPKYSQALASVFPRLSRVGGGVRSAFSSGIQPNGDMFKRNTLAGTNQGPASLSAAAMTGITIAHAGELPSGPQAAGGSNTGTFGSLTPHKSPRSTGHTFTIALTPVGDVFNPPKASYGGRLPVKPGSVPASGDSNFATYGRSLEVAETLLPADRPFKVGNWLDKVLEYYGIPVPSGSMLPPGAKVTLEITSNTGFGAISNSTSLLGLVNSGTWVGGISCAFDVETADGTAFSHNVNILGDSEE